MTLLPLVLQHAPVHVFRPQPQLRVENGGLEILIAYFRAATIFRCMAEKRPQGRPYVVVSGSTADELERNIYQQVAEGYRLYGPPFIWEGRACQVVVKGVPKKLLFG